MQFPEGRRDQYDAVMAELGLDKSDGEWPPGLVSHLGGESSAGGWCVIDVWDSRDRFDEFYAERLAPATQSVGIEAGGPPIEVAVYNMHEGSPASVSAYG